MITTTIVRNTLAGMTLLLIPALSQAQNVTDRSSSGSLSSSGSIAETGPSDASSGSQVTYAPTSINEVAPTTIAPDVGVANGNACASTSGGSGAGAGIFAFSLVVNHQVKACEQQTYAGDWQALGDRDMAYGALCLNPDEAKLYQAVHGVPCPGQPGWVPVQTNAQVPVAQNTAPQRPIVLDSSPLATSDKLNGDVLASDQP